MTSSGNNCSRHCNFFPSVQNKAEQMILYALNNTCYLKKVPLNALKQSHSLGQTRCNNLRLAFQNKSTITSAAEVLNTQNLAVFLFLNKAYFGEIQYNIVPPKNKMLNVFLSSFLLPDAIYTSTFSTNHVCFFTQQWGKSSGPELEGFHSGSSLPQPDVNMVHVYNCHPFSSQRIVQVTGARLTS